MRMSGEDAIKIANQVFKGANLAKVDTHTIHYGHIINPQNDQVIDEVMVTVLRFNWILQYKGLNRLEEVGNYPVKCNRRLETNCHYTNHHCHTICHNLSVIMHFFY